MKALISAEELAALEQGLPRLSDWGADLLVPFSVHQLRNAKVLWLNTRWFLERGMDVTDTAVLSRVREWLVEMFGYLIPEPGHDPSAFTGRTKLAHADRYGSSSGLAKHGGSGRVAVYGCFQAKGVGATPLVGADVSPDHRNGCVSAGEALREVIYAEVMAAEFPYGAVPVIAILDTGLSYSAPEPGADGIQKVRRAIVVRPSVLRPAHAERAPLFKRSVTGQVADQTCDVNRTRTFIRRWMRQDQGAVVTSLRESLGRLAEQAAFAHVHRLYTGGFFSSNMAVTGELLDFGNAYALPDWVNARVLAHTRGFGGELEAIRVFARSMDFYFRKYAEGGQYTHHSEELVEHAERRYHDAFSRECLRAWQAESLAGTKEGDQIVELLRAFFRRQQRASRQYGWSGEVLGSSGREAQDDWLHDALIGLQPSSSDSEESAKYVVAQIIVLLREGFGSKPDAASRVWVSKLTACRLLRRRHCIDRGYLLSSVKRLTAQLDFGANDCLEQITDFVRTTVRHGRAHWPRSPRGLGVLAQASSDGCTALLCSDGPEAPRLWWLEGIRLQGRVYLFGTWVPLDSKELYDHREDEGGRYYSFVVPDTGTNQGAHAMVRLGRHEIRIPEVTDCAPANMASLSSG